MQGPPGRPGAVFADTRARRAARRAVRRTAASASQWLTDFDDFLQVYGDRQEATCDVGVPSWIEDNQIPLGLIKSFLLKEDDHDFEAAARNAMAEREEAIDAARSGLTREEQAVFDAGLASNQEANFPWWQDDHNYYIDLKVMLPLRRVCQELAAPRRRRRTGRHALPVLARAHRRRERQAVQR